MMTGMGMGLGLLLMLVFWGGLILVAVLLAKAIFGGFRPPQDRPDGALLTPRQILDQRYARGEISREQYELMKSDLG